jgi:hypothetical protein
MGSPDRLRLTNQQQQILGKPLGYLGTRNPYALETFVDRALVLLALRTDPEWPNHLVEEYQGCDREIVLVDPFWRAAQEAIDDALMAALWSDCLAPDLTAWLLAPWTAAIAPNKVLSR